MEFCGKLWPITALFTQCLLLARNRPCLRLAGSYLARYTQCHALQGKKKKQNMQNLNTHTHTTVCLQHKDHKTERQINRRHTNVLSQLLLFFPLPNVIKNTFVITNHCVFSRYFPISSVQSERSGKLTFAWLLGGRASTEAWATGMRPLWSSTRWTMCAPCADRQSHGLSHTHPGERPLYGSVKTCVTGWMRNDFFFLKKGEKKKENINNTEAHL